MCLYESLPVLQSLSPFMAPSLTPRLFFAPRWGPLRFFPSPVRAPRLSIIVSPSATVLHSLSHNLSVSLAHSLLPSSEAAQSVALSLNPARLNASTWLHVHTPTFMAKSQNACFY